MALWFSVTDSGWERMEEEDYYEEDDDRYVYAVNYVQESNNSIGNCK